MRQQLSISILFTGILILSSMCSNPDIVQERNADIAEIAKTIDDCIGWVKTKDLDLLYSIVANDPDYLSVHPSDKIVRGFDQFKENVPFWMSPDLKYVNHEISDLTINLSRNGDVAWFYCKLDDINTWKIPGKDSRPIGKTPAGPASSKSETANGLSSSSIFHLLNKFTHK